MSQRDIIEFLELEYMKDKERWHSAVEIRTGLKLRNNGINCSSYTSGAIYNDLYRLMLSNLIEYKGEGLFNHRKLFRAKEP